MIHPRTHSLYRSGTEGALPAAHRDVARLAEMLATGKRVNRASDDAPAYARARSLDALSLRHDAYTRGAENGMDWLNHTQSALGSLSNLFSDAYESGIRGINDTMSADDREVVARHLETLIQASLDDLNTQVGDEYLFAGTATVLPGTTKPFEITALGPVYNGNGGERQRQIGPSATVPSNLPGSMLQTTPGGVSVLGSLQELADALRGIGPLTPSDALAQVQQARDHIVNMGAEAGERARRLDLALEQIREARLPIEAERSRAEDTDFLAATGEFQDAQTRLQAALKVTAAIKQTSLLDYL